MNKENVKKVLDAIKANPESWDQTQWHCGSSHCFAGHAQLMSGNPQDSRTTRRDARAFLDMSRVDADWAFAGHRTLDELKELLSDGYDRDGYDRDGYDRDGYDRDGYDRDSYNHDGYDHDGYDHDGYDRDGLDRDGYNRDGYNRDGYNRDGLDRDGYNRDGYDRDGLDRDGLDRNNRP
jgi:hypothetical protein